MTLSTLARDILSLNARFWALLHAVANESANKAANDHGMSIVLAARLARLSVTQAVNLADAAELQFLICPPDTLESVLNAIESERRYYGRNVDLGGAEGGTALIWVAAREAARVDALEAGARFALPDRLLRRIALLDLDQLAELGRRVPFAPTARGSKALEMLMAHVEANRTDDELEPMREAAVLSMTRAA